jgi:hypothetical protein
MTTIAQTYEALGRSIARLSDSSFAKTQGFTGGAKQLRLLRSAHARAAPLTHAELADLGRLIADYLSPHSEIATLCGAVLGQQLRCYAVGFKRRASAVVHGAADGCIIQARRCGSREDGA